MGHVTWLSMLALVVIQSCFLVPTTSSAARKTYIVQMKPHMKPSAYLTHHDWYASQLQSLSSSSTHGDNDDEPSSSLVYTYEEAYNGFAAALSPEEAESLRSSDAVAGVYEDTVYQLHTTRTPEFLGLEDDNHLRADLGPKNKFVKHDVIIGVLDTGVWPESKSYDDSGLAAVPARWRGECEHATDFDPRRHCNKKLIGARYFSRGFQMASGPGFGPGKSEPESPRDYDGHGTHTSSTAAGASVGNSSFLGYASGTARGMAPYARVATYKVCWKTGCFGSDILAGIDRAIKDGVDVLSLSLGGSSSPYYRDTIAIGAFSAMERGIFVSCSAGNSGPAKFSIANVAPWIMTVGAGTLDRDFPAYAVMGNGKKFTGVSLYSGKGMTSKGLVGLVYNKGNSSSNLCLPGSLSPAVAKGKIVVCDRGVNARVEKGAVVRDAGGVGMILANTVESGEELVADSHLLPAVAVGRIVGDVIREYALKGKSPLAALRFGGTVVNVKPSPVVAAFSSRGPNMVTPEILKPDLIGPGVNILAAWSGAIGPTGLDKDLRRTPFNIVSGTSMSCPHISGLAALLKAAHPTWSPSAIKSALMTTAYVIDNTGSPLRDAAGGVPSTPMAHGSGHVDPHKALSPGLVYDITPAEYVKFICSLGYKTEQVQLIAKRPTIDCTRRFTDPGQLNYPSFSVLFGRKNVVRYTRELTNVGAAGSVYRVRVEAPPSVAVSIKPLQFVFKNVGEKQRYTVTFVSNKNTNATLGSRNAFGSISWNNAEHQVRSPIAFTWSHL